MSLNYFGGFFTILILLVTYNLIDFNEEFIVMMGSVSILYLAYYQFFLMSTSLYPLDGLSSKINQIYYLFLSLSTSTTVFILTQTQTLSVIPKIKYELYKKLEILDGFLITLQESLNQQYFYNIKKELLILKYLHKLDLKAFRYFNLTKSISLLL